MNAHKNDLLNKLEKVEFLKGVDPGTLSSMIEVGRTVSFNEDDKIYEFGDSVADVYILLSGRIRFALGYHGAQSIIESHQVFGWSALIEDQPRYLATAICLEPSTVLALPGQKVMEEFESNPVAGFIIMRRIARWIANDFLMVVSG